MTTPISAAKDQGALNPNVVLGVLLTAVLAASIMGFFHLDTKIERLETRMDARFDQMETRMDARFDQMDARFDRLTELLLSGKIQVTAP